MLLIYSSDKYSEKVMKLDAKRREYDIVAIGEEPYLAYNRVGLTSFFDHRNVEQLYMQPQTWVSLRMLLLRDVVLTRMTVRFRTYRLSDVPY